MAFGRAVKNVKTSVGTESVYLPSFDHAVRNPLENGICILKNTKIVLVEGNYILLGEIGLPSSHQNI